MTLTTEQTQTRASMPSRHQFTVREFRRMAEVGILTEEDRVELIEGEVVEMTPIGSKHAACVKRLLRDLPSKVGDQAMMDVQNPVELSDRSELYPDVVLLKPRQDAYEEAHPGATDIFLVIEVSDTTLVYDQQVKVPIYAREGIPEVWVIDLTSEKVWVYRRPSPQGYLDMHAVERGEALHVQHLADVSLEIDSVLD